MSYGWFCVDCHEDFATRDDHSHCRTCKAIVKYNSAAVICGYCAYLKSL